MSWLGITSCFQYCPVSNSSSSSNQANFWLNEQDFQNLEQGLTQDNPGARTAFNLFISRFSTHTDHPFMQHSPAICIKFVPLMERELNAGNIEAPLVKKVIRQFARFQVFTSQWIQEDVEIQCRTVGGCVPFGTLDLLQLNVQRVFGNARIRLKAMSVRDATEPLLFEALNFSLRVST